MFNMADSNLIKHERGAVLAPLALLVLLQAGGAAWGQSAQRKQNEPLAVEQKADLRRDVAHEQSRGNEDQAKSPNERRLSPAQRAELRRQLREQSRDQARESATPAGKKP